MCNRVVSSLCGMVQLWALQDVRRCHVSSEGRIHGVLRTSVRSWSVLCRSGFDGTGEDQSTRLLHGCIGRDFVSSCRSENAADLLDDAQRLPDSHRHDGLRCQHRRHSHKIRCDFRSASMSWASPEARCNVGRHSNCTFEGRGFVRSPNSWLLHPVPNHPKTVRYTFLFHSFWVLHLEISTDMKEFWQSGKAAVSWGEITSAGLHHLADCRGVLRRAVEHERYRSGIPGVSFHCNCVR